MDNFIAYVWDNKEWLFSGVGALVLTMASRVIFPSKPQLVVHKHSTEIPEKAPPKYQGVEKITPLDNRVTFSDGTFAEVDVDGVMQMFDPKKVLDGHNTFEILRKATDSCLRQTLETMSVVEARTRRKEIGEELVEKLQGIYNEHGVMLKVLNIGRIQEIRNG